MEWSYLNDGHVTFIETSKFKVSPVQCSVLRKSRFCILIVLIYYAATFEKNVFKKYPKFASTRVLSNHWSHVDWPVMASFFRLHRKGNLEDLINNCEEYKKSRNSIRSFIIYSSFLITSLDNSWKSRNNNVGDIFLRNAKHKCTRLYFVIVPSSTHPDISRIFGFSFEKTFRKQPSASRIKWDNFGFQLCSVTLSEEQSIIHQNKLQYTFYQIYVIYTLFNVTQFLIFNFLVQLTLNLWQL